MTTSTLENIKDVTPVISLIFAVVFLAAGAWFSSKQDKLREARNEKRVEKAEEEVKESPEKAKPAWDLARANLELYFERNRAQVRQVFVIAIIAMFIGFAFVLAGVVLAFKETMKPSLVAGCSGIITEFIGVTFMVIYRSTVNQANEFMAILERINTVGMAIQVLDSISELEQKLKNDTRAQIVSSLLNYNLKAKLPASRKRQATTAGR